MSFERVTQSRWNRKRKLLPLLKLTYPEHNELRQIAKLAKVDDHLSFGEHIRSLVLDAHLNDASLRKLSIPHARKILHKVADQARRLQSTLTAIDVGSRGSLHRAGMLLELELSKSQFRGDMIVLPDYLALLDTLTHAGQQAALLCKSGRGPKGAGGNRAFDWFVQGLVMAAWQRGANWTHYRQADGTWNGSLLKGLEILRPYLPPGFFPVGVLGRSVEHIRRKLKDHITKHLAIEGHV